MGSPENGDGDADPIDRSCGYEAFADELFHRGSPVIVGEAFFASGLSMLLEVG